MRQARGDAASVLRVFLEHALQQSAEHGVDAAYVPLHVGVDDRICVVVRQPLQKLPLVASFLLPFSVPRGKHWDKKDGLHETHTDAPNVHEPGRHQRSIDGASMVADRARQLWWHIQRREAPLAAGQGESLVCQLSPIEVNEFPPNADVFLVPVREPDHIHRLDVHVHEAADVEAPGDADQGPEQISELDGRHVGSALPRATLLQIFLQGVAPQLLDDVEQACLLIDARTRVLALRVVQQLDEASADVESV
mmetsp:Transcript_44356/g.117382  ORF Transcript_44356/g.117382 Transcript_44356/m.117382 type:complete len:251 (+) Transcript_44356:258-1010(+)